VKSPDPCPCGSGKRLSLCCQPYLDGAAPPTAEALMRSRYTAYATGAFAHLQRTITAAMALGFDRAGVAAEAAGVVWTGLEIVAVSRGGAADAAGEVEFRARFRQGGVDQVLHERSRFVREDGAWKYAGGTLFRDAARKPGRNDPCPCGSGRKFKKCCGA
jgi:SEC-C motif-containing protein